MKRDPKCAVKVENLVAGKEYYYFDMEDEYPLTIKYIEMIVMFGCDTYLFGIEGDDVQNLDFSKSGVEEFIEEI